MSFELNAKIQCDYISYLHDIQAADGTPALAVVDEDTKEGYTIVSVLTPWVIGIPNYNALVEMAGVKDIKEVFKAEIDFVHELIIIRER